MVCTFWRSYPFVEIDRLFDDTFVGVLRKYYFIVQNCHAMHVIDKLNGYVACELCVIHELRVIAIIKNKANYVICTRELHPLEVKT